jgi:hypothetical protein
MVSITRVIVAALGFAGAGLLAAAAPAGAQTGTWTLLAHPFPGTGSTANPALPAGTIGPGTALMLTDGSIIMHDTCTPSWFRLLPRGDGTFANMYINGDWSATASGDNAALAPMIGTGAAPDNYGPLYFASVVLPDGRFIINGGEAENSTGACQTQPTPADSTKGSFFDPNANTWTSVPPPPAQPPNFPTAWATIGDAMGILLGANNITGAYSAASYALQQCCSGSNELAVASITPRPGTTVTWTRFNTGKVSQNDEEGWVRLPNGELLSVDAAPCASPPNACNPTAAERLVVGANPPTWVSAGATTTSLVSQNPLAELGPGIGIGFNTVVWFGATNAIQLFRYPGTNNNWFAQTAYPAGPATCTVPAGQTQGVADGPASLLPSGNILVQTSPVGGALGFNPPSCFWEFQSSTLSPTNTGPVAPTATVNQPQCNSGTANTTNLASFKARMLLLPTGQVLWDAGGGVYVTGTTRNDAGGSPPCVYVYASNTTADPNKVMRPDPHINTISNNTLTRGNTNYTITGSMFRGWSQGAAYGDDAQAATDFPIVMITNNATGNRCFGRTHDWSNLISIQFDLPPAVTPAPGWALVQRACDTAGGGASTLVVIVNGRQSNPIAVTVN